MSKRRLYKYFSARKYGEAFLEEGALLFRSLSYFRDDEDGNVREDHHEGTSVFRPPVVAPSSREGTRAAGEPGALAGGIEVTKAGVHETAGATGVVGSVHSLEQQRAPSAVHGGRGAGRIRLPA